MRTGTTRVSIAFPMTSPIRAIQCGANVFWVQAPAIASTTTTTMNQRTKR